LVPSQILMHSPEGYPRGSPLGSSADDPIRRYFPGRCPLVFGGVTLYNPPTSDMRRVSRAGTRADHGTAVLLDPEELRRVGVHEFLFFPDHSSEPAIRWTIGPGVRVVECEPPEGGSEHAVFLLFVVRGEYGCGLAFDAVGDAKDFLRDFTVRSRLMTLSLKVAHGKTEAQSLQEQVEALRVSVLDVLPLLRGWLWWVCIIAVILVFIRSGFLMLSDADQPAHAALQTAAGEFVELASLAGRGFQVAGETGCEFMGQKTLPDTVLLQCSAMSDLAMRRCLGSAVRSEFP